MPGVSAPLLKCSAAATSPAEHLLAVDNGIPQPANLTVPLGTSAESLDIGATHRDAGGSRVNGVLLSRSVGGRFGECVQPGLLIA